MTRFEFYSKCIILTIIGSVWVYFSADKETMTRQVMWVITSTASALIWCEWTVLPKSWTRKLFNKDSDK